MTTHPKTTKDLSIYDTPTVDWAQVEAAMAEDLTQAPGTGGPDRHTCWLATIQPDDRPHLTGVGAQHVDGAWYFTSGPGVRKTKNIERDPRCSLSVALDDFDVTVDGTAERVTDEATLDRLVAVYAEGGWPCHREGDALGADFSAPSAGPGPWHLYRITTDRAVALAVHEGGAARWDF